jgi:photosystem II stability/assembly factor-like uncharacterized protein
VPACGILAIILVVYWVLARQPSRKQTGENSQQPAKAEGLPLGWVGGESGAILHTQDGGRTWQKQDSGAPAEDWINSINFITPQLGWAAGYRGTIFHTEDGGRTWLKQSQVSDILIFVSFQTPREGWLLGLNHKMSHTEDGGRTWQQQVSGTMNTLNSITFVTPQSGWAVGDSGTILHTEDSGRSWQRSKSPARVSISNPLSL